METAIVKTEENKVHERTDLSFLIKNATRPVSKGINISKTGIIKSILKFWNWEILKLTRFRLFLFLHFAILVPLEAGGKF